jgi:hypothetical protein
MELAKRRTPVNLYISTYNRLESLKIHPNQSFDELINQLLDKLEAKEPKATGCAECKS